MNSLFSSLQKIGAVAAALTGIGSAPPFARATALQDSVRILCRAVRHLGQHIPEAPVRPSRRPPPEPVLLEALPPIVDPSPMRVDHPLAFQEVNGCKALLLEVVRRAAYDWVLYRTSQRLQYKKLAEDAYYWLFVEEPGHQNWTERSMAQKSITSFLSICEVLDLDPEAVRREVKKLTIRNVMHVGRPAEYRRNEWREEEHCLTSGINEKVFAPFEEEFSFYEEG